jgi:hypothetical protein
MYNMVILQQVAADLEEKKNIVLAKLKTLQLEQKEKQDMIHV